MIQLDELERTSCPGLTPILGANLAEAATVCLENQGHASGVHLEVEEPPFTSTTLEWSALHPKARAARNDLVEATEAGAYGIAILLAINTTQYTVIERSRIGTGFDYWLGKAGGAPLFQDKARLEVSGILTGSRNDVRARLKKKVKQIERSASMQLPGIVVIVEFGTPSVSARICHT